MVNGTNIPWRRFKPGAFGIVVLAAALFMLRDLGPAHAQHEAPNDRPLLVNFLELEKGFDFVRRRGGSTGVVYTLGRADLSGRQMIQVAYDKRMNAKILRLVQELTDNPISNSLAFGQLAIELAAMAQPTWAEAKTAIPADVKLLMEAYAQRPRDLGRQIPIRDRMVANLRTQGRANSAIIDIPITAPRQTKPSAEALRTLIAGSTFLIATLEGGRTTVYHDPSGRYARREVGSEEAGNGSWQVAPGGKYCREEAPEPGWICDFLYHEDDHLVLVAAKGERVSGRIIAYVARTNGNAYNLPIIAVPRALDATNAERLTKRRSWTVTPADGAQRTITYFRGDGLYIQEYGAEETAEGTWAILKDGRRCIKQSYPEESAWSCVFLRNSGGDTYQILANDGSMVGTATYRNGNPDNL